jgi:glycosyltransferase involved in cell wall biosynthesis
MSTTADIFSSMKVCVLIPTYNNAGTLARVISDVAAYTRNIVVVNDGSTDDTVAILKQFPFLSIESYGPNQGKGKALQTGFRRAVELGYDYAITIDSDGQHFADDLPVFLEKLKAHPRAIIIGARNMDQSSVPGKSSFGNKFSNFWFRLETGIRISDTQSGYRLYPVRLLYDRRYFSRKYEFEIEVLVRAAWSGIEVVQVPVKVFYAEKSERVSHFRPFRDFTRISILNTFLVIITFLWIKPRDFYRSIKKKTSGTFCTSTSSVRMSPTH